MPQRPTISDMRKALKQMEARNPEFAKYPQEMKEGIVRIAFLLVNRFQTKEALANFINTYLAPKQKEQSQRTA